jgi:transcriptional regulator with XRE-family HTH domain
MNLPSGKQIRAARNLLGYSADDLAQRLGAHASQIYRIERKQSRSLAVRLTAELESIGARFINGGVILQDSNGQRRS